MRNAFDELKIQVSMKPVSLGLRPSSLIGSHEIEDVTLLHFLSAGKPEEVEGRLIEILRCAV